MKVTDTLIKQEGIATLMVTHNMKHALEYGNRLIMMNEGKIVRDIKGETKSALSTSDVIQMFKDTAGSDSIEDRMVLGY